MKKIISIGLTGMFLLMGIMTVSASETGTAETESSNSSPFRSIFAANPLINIKFEHSDGSAIPNSGVLEISLETYYHLSGFFAAWQLQRLKNDVIRIELSVEDKPDWCDAVIINPHVELSIGSSEPFQSTLSLTITEQAPAFTVHSVQIKATSPELKGLFFTRVRGGEVTVDIPFEVGYWPVISYELPEGNQMEIPPQKVTEIPIKFYNLGNGPTYVIIEILDPPNKWNFTVPTSVIVASPLEGKGNDEKEIEILVRPPKSFSSKTIEIKFTPYYVGSPDLTGSSEIISIDFKNDGSLKDNEGLDLYLVAIIVVAVILITLASIFLKRKYAKK